MGRSTTLEELISRQRVNLQKTFFEAEAAPLDDRSVQRLAKAERELARATADFAEGIAQRAGPVPCLDEAADAMVRAARELDKKGLGPACGHQEAALAELIKARQNLRQMLSQSSSSSSSCRQFDQQQKQKLSPPPPPKEEQARKQQKDSKKDPQTCKLQERIDKLAQSQRQCTREAQSQCQSGGQAGSQGQSSRGGSAKADTSKMDNGSTRSETSKPESLADRQEKAAGEAADLQREARQDEGLTELACRRMGDAARAIQSSAQSFRKGRPGEGGAQAQEAAEQLDRVSQQVAALKAAELSQKLSAAGNLARRLAEQQRAAAPDSRPGPSEDKQREADRQHGRAEDARTLDDLMKEIPRQAAETDPKLAESLREASRQSTPDEIARQMDRAAEALREGRREEARRQMQEAGQRLGDLAQKLEAARRGLVQPQLEKLMAAERKAAELQKSLAGEHDAQARGEIEKKMTELRDAMDRLSNADPRLRQAAERLADAFGVSGRSEWRTVRPGFYEAPKQYPEVVLGIVQALQVRIQEMILADALLDQDEPVPPQYQKQVEAYYRVLSDDLR